MTMKTKNYINPAVIAGTIQVLERYKSEHPESDTPMADACANVPVDERKRFVRAAQRLKWNVVRSNGHVYESGVMVW